MICGSIGYPDSSALLEISVRGQQMHLFFERERIFRVCTGEGPRGVHAILSLHFFDALADRMGQRPSAPHQGSRAGDHRSEHVDARASERMH